MLRATGACSRSPSLRCVGGRTSAAMLPTAMAAADGEHEVGEQVLAEEHVRESSKW